MRRIDGRTIITQGTIAQTFYSSTEALDNVYGISAHVKYTDATPSALSFATTAVAPVLFTKASHGLLTGNAVVLTTSGGLPAPLALSTTYYVIRVDANTFQLATTFANATAVQPIAVTTQGTGNHTATVSVPAAFTFAPTDVTLAAKTVTKTAHGLCTGEEVKFTTTTTLPSGWVSGTSYYAVYVDANTFYICDTQAHAISGSPATYAVDPVDQGSGTHTCTAQSQAAQTLAYTAVTVGDNTITSAAHGMVVGLKGRFTTTTTLPTGLSAGVDYYVIPTSANKFQVATSLVNASAGVAVDLTSVGTGTHTFTATALSGTITPQMSNDVTNLGWVDDTANAVNLSSAGAAFLTKPTYQCQSWRLKVAITAGQISCASVANAETDGGMP